MLDPIIVANNGSCLLNALKRWTLSAVVVPRQDLALINVPTAPSATQPGMSTPIPLQGPSDGKTELYSFTARTNSAILNAGIGTVSTPGGSAVITGVGTKFKTQLVAGLNLLILLDNGTVANVTILSIASDTSLTLTGVIATAATAKAFSYRLNIATGYSHNYLFVRIQDQAWRRYLMNRDVPAIHVFGSNTKPEFIKESIFLEEDQGLLLNFFNYNTSNPATIYPMTEGRKWQFEATKYPKVKQFCNDLRLRKKWVQPFWLTLDDGFLEIAQGSSKGAFFTCTGDITLVLFNAYANAVALDGAFTDVTDAVTIELFDAKTKRALTVQPVPLSCAAGTSQDPYRLPTPWIVEPQTQIRANFAVPSSVGHTARILMTFHGVAIYTGSNFNGSTLTNRHLVEEAGRMYNAMSMPQIRSAGPQI